MELLDQSSVVLIAVLTAIFASVASTMLLILRDRRYREYDMKNHRSQLEMMRAMMESQIYSRNERLASTAERWGDINHLLLSSQRYTPEVGGNLDVPSTRFLRSAGIDRDELQPQEDLVFVLTPFHPKYEDTFETIASVCRSSGLRCLRGDEEFIQGDIMRHILKNLVQARVVVANIDGRNPNVYYELGIAHALGKPTILVSRTVDNLPFDLKARRVIIYDDLRDLKDKLKDEMIKTLANA